MPPKSQTPGLDQVAPTEVRRRGVVSALLLVLLCAVPTEAQLEASFSAAPVSGTNPLTVQFTDTTSGGEPLFRIWTYGDGGSDVVADPVHTHTYTTPGTYSVSLAVFTADDLDSVIAADLITVAPADLDASFEVHPSRGVLPLEVQFTNTSTGVRPDDTRWSFGDGGGSTASDPVHVYLEPGTYEVTLELTYGGQVASQTVPDAVVVVAPPLTVDFGAAPTSGPLPLLVDFTDLSSGTEATGWSWDFGDGAASVEQHPTHAYLQAGVYPVSLTTQVPGHEESATKAGLVRVRPPVLGGGFQETATLDGAFGFGRSVALDGDTLAVLAGGGDDTVRVFERGATGVWRRAFTADVHTLLADLALDGDTLVVGSPLGRMEGVAGTVQAGVVTVFARDDEGAWQEAQELFASDGAEGHRFGWSVAVDGDGLLVGAPGADTPADGSGAVYLFEREAEGRWQERGRLEGDDFETFFGASVAISAEHLAATSIEPGTVHVFERQPGGGFDEQVLTPADFVVAGPEFALDDGRILASSPDGMVHAFEPSPGGRWTEVEVFGTTDPDIQPFSLGRSLALDGDRAVVASWLVANASFPGQLLGAAHVFDRGPTGWTETARLLPSASPGNFGHELDLSGATVAAADQGAVFLFDDRSLPARPTLALEGGGTSLHLSGAPPGARAVLLLGAGHPASGHAAVDLHLPLVTDPFGEARIPIPTPPPSEERVLSALPWAREETPTRATPTLHLQVVVQPADGEPGHSNVVAWPD